MENELIILYSIVDNNKVEELGIASIAAVLRKNDFKVEILQLSTRDIDINIYTSKAPKIIAFNVFNTNIEFIICLSERIKQELSDTKIIFVGHFASKNREKILINSKCIDYVVRDEGEYTFLQLAEVLLCKKKIDI